MVSKKVKLKKALSLIEVIIAISLLSFVIVTLLSLKDQNIFLINKVKGSFITNTYFSSLVLSTEIKEGENKKIYLSDVMTFSKDEDNRMLKNIKIHFKNKQYDKEEFNLPLKKIEFTKFENIYKYENRTKIFYTFGLN
ncbi:MAG: hypothetical protein MJK08_05195 [Campylobacterales bacterium]|nr:hypothetical protein [Campylobacterales bacterium]